MIAAAAIPPPPPPEPPVSMARTSRHGIMSHASQVRPPSAAACHREVGGLTPPPPPSLRAQVPTKCSNVPDAVLLPEKAWPDKADFTKTLGVSHSHSHTHAHDARGPRATNRTAHLLNPPADRPARPEP